MKTGGATRKAVSSGIITLPFPWRSSVFKFLLLQLFMQ